MAKKNNIARNIAIGVAAGVAVSMLKKKTAKSKNTKKAKMIEIGENAKIKEKVQTVTDKGRELADFNVVKAKVAEINAICCRDVKRNERNFSKKKLNQKKSQKRLKFKLYLKGR